jgi:hypothetical protein
MIGPTAVSPGHDRNAVAIYATSLCAGEAFSNRAANELTNATYGLTYTLSSVAREPNLPFPGR